MSHPRSSLNVLIVEDEALLAMDIEAMVEDLGHNVVGEAASLREVEGLRRDLHIDIAFVDIHLAEGTSGLDVSRFLRAQWSEALVVFVTANPLKLPADFAGGDGVIPKPFSRDGMLSAIRYIEEGVLRPPPTSAQPSSFFLSPARTASWHG